ncbi:MAG: histidine phosphatase family protein [Pseudomonadota bacterium]
MKRRELLGLAAALPWPVQADDANGLVASLRTGGVVMAFRHALAPGTFDPPGFRLGDCSTQRNLNGQGRAQAQRMGEWFRQRQLVPAVVRSSPWCRCLDTARLAFGAADAWAALGSPVANVEATNEAAVAELRGALAAAAGERGRFEVWVTHQFVLSALADGPAASGEGLLLSGALDGTPRLLGRLIL